MEHNLQYIFVQKVLAKSRAGETLACCLNATEQLEQHVPTCRNADRQWPADLLFPLGHELQHMCIPDKGKQFLCVYKVQSATAVHILNLRTGHLQLF